jgi:hypothetical protein
VTKSFPKTPTKIKQTKRAIQIESPFAFSFNFQLFTQ